ncbi:MAG: DegT/DnrJ/EryC1/StrS family aminotransferase [Verrucomicrobia bacterium]|nr:DegT/DnrJ/EryC1/StrS family aminotransferase [Verrucomicrobiota bacterium]
MNIPLLDLKAQYASIRAEIEPVIREVVESQYFINGPQVAACERDVAAYCGAAHAIGVSSGTDALLVALMTEGIGPGDEVITTPYTFFATAGSIARVGARPVFVDIDPVTFNIDPARVAAAVTPRTKALMPVHLYGQLADMEALGAIAARHGLVMIEDAAQAIGAAHRGLRAGSIGDYGCFSFFPSKNLGCFGDGGMVTTNDPARAEKLAVMRMHGMKPKYIHKFIGGNFRFDTLQAAVVQVKLRHLDAWTEGRRLNAARYDRLFQESGLAGRDAVRLPAVTTDRHIFNQYVIRVDRRDALIEHLRKAQVGCEVYYPVPLHLQECFADLGHKPGDFPVSERAALETLALPVYPELSDAQAAYVVDTIRGFCG